jgi:hypothetical protein
MIRLTDLSGIGAALAEVRTMLGLARTDCARRIAAASGRSWRSVNSQLWTWDQGACSPDLPSLRHYLDAIDFDLALVGRSEDPKRQLVLLAAVDNALRNGSYMTGANLAFDMLCKDLGVDRDTLTFDPRWARQTPG